MAKYRFKRLDEYDASEINTSRGIPVSWTLDMSFYMGADIPDEYNEHCDKNRGFGMSGWWFKANEYVKKEVVVDNIVIENTSEEHGERIIKYFQSLGIDTRRHIGNFYSPNNIHVFYGVINGRFNNYSIDMVNRQGASIIKLPEDQVSKTSDVVEYFDDLSQHIGRYLKALINYPNYGSVRAGEIGIIKSSRTVDFPSQKSYTCTCALSEKYLNIRYELMPIDYHPESTDDSVYEYVECLNLSGWSKTIKANNGYPIFKTSDFDFNSVDIHSSWTWKKVLEEYEGSSWVKSTKDKYEKQFITENNKHEQVYNFEKTQQQSDIVHNHKTFIEPVHSVNLKLRTKNKSIKF
jgi:hypothetical protein